MKRKIKIELNSTDELRIKIITFFQCYNFELLEINNESVLKFKNKGSLLDGWKSNPLDWKSEISIIFNQNSLEVIFNIDTLSQMKTYEELKVWEIFIETFQSFLIEGNTKNSTLISAISESKKSRFSYFGWAIIGILIGLSLNYIYSKFTNDFSILIFILIPFIVYIFLKQRISYVKLKKVI